MKDFLREIVRLFRHMHLFEMGGVSGRVSAGVPTVTSPICASTLTYFPKEVKVSSEILC
jgi:hypothetical protein